MDRIIVEVAVGEQLGVFAEAISLCSGPLWFLCFVTEIT